QLVTMTQAKPVFGDEVSDTAELARVLGAPADAIASHPVPQVVSTAMPQLMIPLGSREALARMPSGGTGSDLMRFLRRYETDCAMCYVLDESRSTAFCRMFAPGLGVPEDPATGSAAGALGAYLAHNGLLDVAGGKAAFTVQQGSEIGRPSTIAVDLHVGATGPTVVRVGGTATRILEGELAL
ncbi:MAG: PhzF family phenazine biosynthesis protein, partial [Gemmatimonadales bacterium]